MDGFVKETNTGVKFDNVSRIECEDKRTNMQCKIIHDDDENTEGKVITDDFVLEDTEVKKFSQVANKTSAEFESNTTCRINDANELLSCSGGMDDTTHA